MDTADLQVIFSLDRISPDPGEVCIFPMKSSWNDFGFKIRCGFRVLLPSYNRTIDGEMFIGFLPPPDSSKSEKKAFDERSPDLEELIQLSGSRSVNKEDLPGFFTLLPEMMEYRNVVDQLKPDGVEPFLRAVNDLVFYRGAKNNWYDAAISTEVFKRGFMRNSEPFFTFHNAESILKGVEHEKFSSISKFLRLSFKLDGFESPHELALNYLNEGIVPRRINVLIGKNGLGKSQALNYFCRAALGYKDKNVKLVDTGVQQGQRNTRIGRPMISRILAIATPGETRNTFPPERLKTQKLFYRRLSLTRDGRSKKLRSIAEALVKLARSEESIGDNSRWELFIGAIKRSLPVESIVIPLIGGELEYLTSFNRGGEQNSLDRWGNVDKKQEPQFYGENKIYPLSSGQLTFFKFALLCCLYIENGSFVLMDEPETHLHPNLISEFVELLDYLLEETGSQALLATHSAYFVREVPKEQVHVFQLHDDKTINIVQPRLRTFGATVDSISQFVFGEDAEIRLTRKIFNKVRGKEFNEVDAEVGEQISLAALMNLRRLMEKS